MKIYRIIIIVLSVLVGISSVWFLVLDLPEQTAAFTDTITEKDYQILKDYALETVKNSDTELNKDIDVTMQISAESLIVDVNTSLYGVKAVFPISNFTWEMKDGSVKYDGTIDYNNVTYSEHTEVESKWFYLMMDIFGIGVFAVPPYFLFYYVPSSIIKRLTKKKDSSKES